jgi:serine phosphatase RsbU (regulator of sigma subunit)/anti-sigma regulatory factor (Ser/Thr protein kinase)
VAEEADEHGPEAGGLGEAGEAAGPEPGEGDAIIGATLEGLRRAVEEVEVERSVAEELQRSLLPERLSQIPGLRLAARYLPASSQDEVGGDWYDVVPLREGQAGLAIGDVVGHGVGAAAHMAHLQSAVRAYSLEGLRPSLVLERTNGFAHTLRRRSLASLLYGVLDPDAATLRFASAGHPPPLIISPGNGLEFAEGAPGSPLGAVGFPAYEESVVPLEPGSVVVLYTDGLVERPDTPLDTGLGALREAAAGLDPDPQRLCDELPRAVLGGHSRDDVAVLAIKLEPLAGETLELYLPAEPESLAPVRRAIARWLRAARAGDAEIYETLVATGEACANAIAHAYPAGEASFEVLASRSEQQIQVQVRDHGRWRPPRGEERRRGLTLMEELMDELEIERTDTGTTVTLRRRLRGEAAEARDGATA